MHVMSLIEEPTFQEQMLVCAILLSKHECDVWSIPMATNGGPFMEMREPREKNNLGGCCCKEQGNVER